MNYKKLTLENLSLNEDLKNFLDYHQEKYINNILSEGTNHNKKKKNLKSALSDFLFAEKYNTVFDMVKIKKKK